MSVQKDDTGRRYVIAEAQVPGTPEQVWQAIATGEGVSSWFVPTEKQEDGTVVTHFGPGMDAVAKETAWEPPHRFAAESSLGPGAPDMATEWVVEAAEGGMCIVRVVHSLFASTDDWDDQLEGIEKGWPDYFANLRLYLTHFQGKECTPFQLMAFSTLSAEETWKRVALPLGFLQTVKGMACHSDGSTPLLRGTVERTGSGGHPHQVLVRLDDPSVGMGHFFVLAMGGAVVVSIRFYLFGSDAKSVAQSAEPLWQEWLAKQFPATAEPPTCE